MLFVLVLGLAHAQAAYGYESHGADWTGGCKSRTAQSPVSFANIYGPALGTFEVNYGRPLPSFTVVNSGFSLEATLPPSGRGVVVHGEVFSLKKVSFHSPAEHTLGAHRPALEVQLMHQAAGSARSAVVSILFDGPPASFLQQPSSPPSQLDFDRDTKAEVEEVDALEKASLAVRNVQPDEPPVAIYAAPAPGDVGFAPGLNGILAQELPLPEAEAASNGTVWDLAALVSGEFYAYAGSATAPPCAETVQWLVSREAHTASAAQLRQFRRALEAVGPEGNWRSLMPLNRRYVEIMKAQKRVAPLTVADTIKDDREFVAKTNAEDAIVISRSAAQYARDVDQRLRTATIAHLKGFLAPSPTAAPTTPAPPPKGLPASDHWLDASHLGRALSSAALNAVDEAAKRLAAEVGGGLHMTQDLSMNFTAQVLGRHDLMEAMSLAQKAARV